MDVLRVTNLKCEYRPDPLGIDVLAPRFSWIIRSDQRSTLQKGYQLVVELADGSTVWDSGFILSDQSIQVPYDGPPLESRTRYYYKVKVRDTRDRESDWSHAWFETALLDHREWMAHWITPNAKEFDPDTKASFLLRKSFTLSDEVASARIYATAAGMYELYANGSKVSDELYTPGWTSYHHRMQYQTYDVTESLVRGENAIGIMLGRGWYNSGMGFNNMKYRYGDRRAVLLQLHVTYQDGREEVIGTDLTWKAAEGPVRYDSIYNGEKYDARLEQEGWKEPGYDDSHWQSVEIVEDLPKERLIAQENWPMRVTQRVRPVSTFVTPSGQQVLDMGQNMVGRIRMSVEAPRGTKITLRHAEVLDQEGNVYFKNLRTAEQKVEYIAKGEGKEDYAPYFTFMGFRYVTVEGYPGEQLPLDAFVGEVIHSDMEPTGEFECSDDRINQLQSNILWSQRGNFVDVPTDCPQRDERLGWTGDAQVFISTALYNYQGGPFFTKWLHDLQADQYADGGVPVVIPDIGAGGSSSAWGDAAVICPWTMYQYYADRRLLSEQYDSMKRWVEYIRAQGDNEYLWNTGFHYGDWLGLDAKEDSYIGATPTDLIATAFYAHSTDLLRNAARVLGKDEDAKTYDALHRNIVKAFQQEFVTERGRIAARTQTAHVLALMFDLVEPSLRSRVADDLVALIAENDYHLTTGFVGTPYLCFVLSNHGYHEVAMKLLLQESYPGWLYSVSKGATTIWEHWDGIKPDGSFWSDDMNSYNHYAYGAIGDWMYRKVAGLDMDPSIPAFKRILIHPMFGTRALTYAKTAHQSMYGRIGSSWQVDGERIEVNIRIPANTTAEVFLPGASLDGLSEGGQKLADVEEIHSVEVEDNGVRLVVGSGAYRFEYTSTTIFRKPFDANSRVKDVTNHQLARAVLQKHMPHLLDGLGPMFFGMVRLKDLASNQMAMVSEQQIAALLADLETIE